MKLPIPIDWWWLLLAPLVVVSFAVMWAINPAIGFANGFSCDSWYFFGIHRHFFDLMGRGTLYWETFYQFDRLAAILPWNYVAPHVSPTLAVELRAWTYLLVTFAAFGYTAKKLFAPFVAALATILLVLSKLFLATLSTDYVTPAGTVWSAVLIAATVTAAFSPRFGRWAIVCGAIAIFNLDVHFQNVFYVAFTPFLFFASPQNFSKDGIGRFIRFALCYAGGLVVGYALLAGYAVSVGRGFDPFHIESGIYLFTHRNEMQYTGLGAQDPSLLLHNSNALILGFVFAFGVASLVASWKKLAALDGETWASVAPVLILLPMAIITYVWETIGMASLRGNAHSSFFYAPMFLSLAASLNRFDALRSARKPIVIAALVATCVALIVLIGPITPFDMFLPALALTLVIVAAAFFRKRLVAAVGAAVAAVAFVAVLYPQEYGAEPWQPNNTAGRADYETIGRATAFLRRVGLPEGQRFKFWTSADWTAALMPRAMIECADYSASFPFLDNNLGDRSKYFPPMRTNALQYLKDGDTVILVSPGSNLAATANAALRELGIQLTPISEERISERPLRISIAATRVVITK